ncbi:hypothetical protein [Streptomyces sp. DH24]|uniref:WXG100 family type VII secretion target n=1 Tax=Streptomyces sp. DH24 TaxID=3040123 RepID=UPI002442DF63|nr:hypothetical protein [Streptomyces sp. DH24]MDG9720082.1 hypothetical protein [Streptomyces sp. DH24]
MSGDENKPNPHAAERQEANKQNGSIDGIADITSAVNPFGSAPIRGFHFGKTSFEGYDLNEMIDIVESASPELLESAATALVDARDAIKEAADELKTNLGEVDWEGEAHGAFYKWGQSLVTTAHDLAGYADVVGTQILAAGSGLASVRKSMPPRDNRSDRKTVDDIPESKRVESNDEYAAALKAEKHRQEAINQMYRLASFYAVSQGTMTKAEEPVFPKMPDVGVPQPKEWIGAEPFPGPGQTGSLTGTRHSETARHPSVAGSAERPQPDALLPSAKELDDSGSRPGRHVGTEIDSVGTLPPQETAKPTPAAPPSTPSPNAPSVTGPPPLPPAAAPSVSRGGTGRTPRFNGVPGFKSATPAPGHGGATHPATPAGRTGTTPPGSAGRATATGAVPMGRGMVGGAPNSGGPAPRQTGGASRVPANGSGAPNPGRTGVGRATNGVVGGKPIPGNAPGAGGNRVPRGTVIGGENMPVPRPTGDRPGQRGVIGAPSSTTGVGQAARRSVARPDGVVGTPNGRTSATRNNGHTSGGIGGTSGAASQQTSGDARARREDRRDGASSTD